MKATALKRKFDTINKAIASQISKLYDLAEDYDDPEFEELLTNYADKLDALVNTDEDPDTSASVLMDYIDNELMAKDDYDED